MIGRPINTLAILSLIEFSGPLWVTVSIYLFDINLFSQNIGQYCSIFESNVHDKLSESLSGNIDK